MQTGLSIPVNSFKIFIHFIWKNQLFFILYIHFYNLYQFIYSTHLFNKIFILLLFFIIFFTSLSLTVYLSLIDQPPSPSNQPPPSSTHPAKHHQLTRPYRPTYPKPHSTQKKAKSTKIPEIPFNPNESQINPIQPETHWSNNQK